MNLSTSISRLARALAAVTAALASGASLSQDILNTNAYVAPENSVDVGVGVSGGNEKDRARFGLYNGLRKHDTNGLFDFNYSNKDAAAGRWLIFQGRNLGLDNRELGVDYRWLGDFRIKVDYSEIVRHDPHTINTLLTGAGTTTPTITLLPVAQIGQGQDLNLELKRKGIGFELQKAFWGNFQVELSFKNQDKSGARLFGVGNSCSAGIGCAGGSGSTTALLMIPEPVDSTIRQFEAKLNYNGPKLKLSGGYYGSFYTNNFGSINPVVAGTTFGNTNGGTFTDAGLRTYFQRPIALWPDSQSHQIYLGGNYALSSHTKLNFKAAYTHATQNENFGAMGLTGGPAGRSDLGGKLDTTRVQAGISSHPWKSLHLTGDVLYQHTDNKTAVAFYNTTAAVPTPANSWTNNPLSPTKFEAKAQAAYHLPWWHLQLIGGAKYEHEDSGMIRQTDNLSGVFGALRQKLETKGYRVELKKTMSETFSGSVAWLSERREGASPWLKPVALPTGGVTQGSENCASVGTNACVFGRTAAVPYTMENMQRDKIRIRGDWSPMERLNFQLQGDFGRDNFRGPTESGLSSAAAYNLALDVDYQLSDNWKARAYWNGNRRTWNMGHTTDYELAMTDISQTIGAGFVGTPFGNLKVGGDVIGMRDIMRYQLRPDQANTNATQIAQLAIGLPNVKYSLVRVNLYGEYIVNKASSVRLDFIHDRTFFDEWTWQGLGNGFPFLYSDNTTLNAKVKQSVNWIGARYVHKFQ